MLFFLGWDLCYLPTQMFFWLVIESFEEEKSDDMPKIRTGRKGDFPTVH